MPSISRKTPLKQACKEYSPEMLKLTVNFNKFASSKTCFPFTLPLQHTVKSIINHDKIGH